MPSQAKEWGNPMNDTADLSMLTLPEIEAFGLTEAALMLDTARQNRKDKSPMAEALDQNLQVWVAIRTLVGEGTLGVPDGIKDNLTRLTGYVADTTFRHGVEISDDAIDTLININLQISEGLLAAQRNSRNVRLN